MATRRNHAVCCCTAGMAALEQAYNWMQAFIGTIQGSIGETSTLAILIGAVLLLVMRIASWRIICWCADGLCAAVPTV